MQKIKNLTTEQFLAIVQNADAKPGGEQFAKNEILIFTEAAIAKESGFEDLETPFDILMNIYNEERDGAYTEAETSEPFDNIDLDNFLISCNIELNF